MCYSKRDVKGGGWPVCGNRGALSKRAELMMYYVVRRGRRAREGVPTIFRVGHSWDSRCATKRPQRVRHDYIQCTTMRAAGKRPWTTRYCPPQRDGVHCSAQRGTAMHSMHSKSRMGGLEDPRMGHTASQPSCQTIPQLTSSLFVPFCATWRVLASDPARSIKGAPSAPCYAGCKSFDLEAMLFCSPK